MSMAVAAAVMGGVQAISAIQQGNQQASQFISQSRGLRSQAAFKRFEGKQASLQHKAQAVNKLQEILQNLARTNAVAGTGSVDAFSGSAEQNKTLGIKTGAFDVITSRTNEDLVIAFAAMQADQLNFQADRALQAASAAKKAGMLNALMAVGSAAFSYASVAGGPAAAATTAPAVNPQLFAAGGGGMQMSGLSSMGVGSIGGPGTGFGNLFRGAGGFSTYGPP